MVRALLVGICLVGMGLAVGDARAQETSSSAGLFAEGAENVEWLAQITQPPAGALTLQDSGSPQNQATPPVRSPSRRSRFRRRSGGDSGSVYRLARAPNMFGDLFGSGNATLTGSLPRPGFLSPASGTANFQNSNVTGGPTLFTFLTVPGNNLQITIPGVTAFGVPNPLGFGVDGNAVPPPTVYVVADPAIIKNIDSFLNDPITQLFFIGQVIAVEQAHFPGATVQTVRIDVKESGTVDFVSPGFDIVFPFVMKTIIETPIAINIPSPATGGAVVGRLKIAENGSPMPRDRVFVNYSHFDNVPLIPGGVDVNRITPGFERTFRDGTVSVEARFPFAATLDSSIDLEGQTNTSEAEFGNVSVTGKAILAETDDWLFSGGLSVTLPTADDSRVGLGAYEVARIENEAVHLLPFLGALYAPDDRFFAQGFMQFDFDTNGHPVLFNTDGTGLQNVGRINDSTFLYLDAAIGYWWYRSTSPGATVTGIAPTFELHYNRSLQKNDVIQVGNSRIGSFADNTELLNAVVVATIELGENRTLGLAFATPIGGGGDQQFDGEFRATMNWYYGGGGSLRDLSLWDAFD